VSDLGSAHSGAATSVDTVRFAPLSLPRSELTRTSPRQARPAKPSVSPAALVPLFYASLLYLAGVVLARYQYLRPSWLLAGLVPLAVVAAIAIAKAPRIAWLPLASIWMVLGAWSAETERLPVADPTVIRLSDGLLRTVEGTVTDAGPVRYSRPGQAEDQEDSYADRSAADASDSQRAQRVDLQLTAVEVVTDASDALVSMQPVETGKIRLSVIGPLTGPSGELVRCGQRLRAVVRLLPPDTFHDQGVWSRAAFLESQDVAATSSVVAGRRDADGPRLQVLAEPIGASVSCLLNGWRNSAITRLQSLPSLTLGMPGFLRASSEDAAMLAALLTGDRTYLTHSLRAGFERTGSFHLIVVSGLHLAVLAGIVFSAAQRLRLHRLAATAITIEISLGYAAFTGFGIPVQRSFWMITLYLIGRLLYRDRSPLNVIGFATLCVAVASPRSIFEASLQMTVLSVAAIAGIAVPLLEKTLGAQIKATQDLRRISMDPKLPPRTAQFRVTLRLIARHLEPAINLRFAWKVMPYTVRSVLRLGELVFVTLVVELALALPMAIYFHRITIYALPVNLCILPLLVILVPGGMILLLVLSIWPAVAVVPATVCLSVLHLSVLIVRKLGALSLGDLRVPEPGPVQAGVAVMLFLLALQLARGSGRLVLLQRRLCLVVLLLASAVGIWPHAVNRPAHALLFEAIDVGQGDSLLLITPDGKSLLIDGGGLGFMGAPNQKDRSEFDIGDEVVSAVLWSRGIRRLDAVALTHAHHDHMGGLGAVLRNFRPRELWIGNNPPNHAYEELLDEAASLGIRVRSFRAGEAISLGEAAIRVLAPGADYRPGPQPANNDSLVLQARYGDTSILLAGDAEASEERSLFRRGDLESSVLKVGHHGSLTSTHPEFLSRVAPAWAIISCGRRNRFGHPRTEILAELQEAHVRTFRTDLDGATCLVLDGKSVTADPMCGASY